MSDIAAFLLARIAEDERGARAAMYEGEAPVYDRGELSLVPDDGQWDTGDELVPTAVMGRGITIYDEGGQTLEQAQHVARWDPARVLAECQAKREVVELYRMLRERTTKDGAAFEDFVGSHALELVCKYLAAPYADHADYDPAWADITDEEPPS